MSRRVEVAMFVVFLLAAVVFAMLGRRAGGGEQLFDSRLSTLLSGPGGARGLEQILEQLGTNVEQRRQSFFNLTFEPEDTTTVLAVLDPVQPLFEQEVLAVRGYVGDGGNLFIAGQVQLARCFGYRIDRIAPFGDTLDVSGADPDRDPLQATAWFVPVVTDSLVEDFLGDAFAECAPFGVTRVDTLLAVTDGRAVAMSLHSESGVEVKLLADSRLLTNHVLKNTESGLWLIPWLLSDSMERVVFDEYHHGFGRGGSLFGAAWAWLRTTPAGWMLLQASVVALLALWASSIRFGKPTASLPHHRRAETEHLDALAAGLQRARDHTTAVRLLIAGLMRRLGRSGRAVRGDNPESWLSNFATAPSNRAAQQALERLTSTADLRDGDRVLSAANAVEDLWNAMASQKQRGEF